MERCCRKCCIFLHGLKDRIQAKEEEEGPSDKQLYDIMIMTSSKLYSVITKNRLFSQLREINIIVYLKQNYTIIITDPHVLLIGIYNQWLRVINQVTVDVRYYIMIKPLENLVSVLYSSWTCTKCFFFQIFLFLVIPSNHQCGYSRCTKNKNNH